MHSLKVKAWVLQASFFYDKVEAVSTARNQRLQKKGEAEEATRDQAIKAWMKDFRTTARMALKDSPQLLEALGMVVKAKKV